MKPKKRCLFQLIQIYKDSLEFSILQKPIISLCLKKSAYVILQRFFKTLKIIL